MDATKMYIETINVYLDESLSMPENCPASGALGSMFSLVAILLSLLITLQL